jgi:hypothetical protein
MTGSSSSSKYNLKLFTPTTIKHTGNKNDLKKFLEHRP